jgi:hypothetical protein
VCCRLTESDAEHVERVVPSVLLATSTAAATALAALLLAAAAVGGAEVAHHAIHLILETSTGGRGDAHREERA